MDRFSTAAGVTILLMWTVQLSSRFDVHDVIGVACALGNLKAHTIFLAARKPRKVWSLRALGRNVFTKDFKENPEELYSHDQHTL